MKWLIIQGNTAIDVSEIKSVKFMVILEKKKEKQAIFGNENCVFL